MVDLKESDEEQGLQSYVLDLLVNSVTNSEQPTASTSIPEVAPVATIIIEQPVEDPAEQPRAEQTSTSEPPMVEPPIADKTITTEPATTESSKAEQTVSAEPQVIE